MMKKTTKFIALLSGAALLTSSAFAADGVSTDPVGYVTVSVAGGASGAPAVSLISLPLLGSVPGSFVGASSGVVTAVTATEVTLSGAGWGAGDLAQAVAPYFVKITSGDADGRIVKISGNTVDTLTLVNEGVALTPDVAIGTSFEIIPGDTLLSAFGTPADGVVGGTAANGAANAGLVDEILVLSTSGWARYFYNTDDAEWQIPELSFLGDQGNVVIPPTGGVVYKRVGEDLDMILTGRVPLGDVAPVIQASGNTLLSITSPAGDTLGGLNIEATPNWRALGDSGVTTADVDLVFVLNGGWKKFYYNRTAGEWYLPEVEFLGDKSSEVIPSGGAVIISRFGAAGSDLFTHVMPY